MMKKVLLGLIPWIIVAVIVYFFSRALVDNWHKLSPEDFQFNAWAIVGIALLVAAVVTSGVLWGKLLTTLSGKKVVARDSIRIHAASWLLKYVPGQVGSLVNKLSWAKANDISQKTTATSFVYENILTLLASIVVSVPLVAIFGEVVIQNGSLLLPVLIVIPLLIVTYRPVFYWLLNTAFKRMGKKPFRPTDFLGSGQLLGYLLAYLLPRVLNAVGFVFIAASLLPVEPHMYVGLGATYVLASIIGLLAIFVPGGIGVREAVIVVFAGLYFPIEQAIILSIVARLYATIADAGVAGVYLILNKGRIRQ